MTFSCFVRDSKKRPFPKFKGGRLFDGGRLSNNFTFRMGAYSRVGAYLRGALIRSITVIEMKHDSLRMKKKKKV